MISVVERKRGVGDRILSSLRMKRIGRFERERRDRCGLGLYRDLYRIGIDL